MQWKAEDISDFSAIFIFKDENLRQVAQVFFIFIRFIQLQIYTLNEDYPRSLR